MPGGAGLRSVPRNVEASADIATLGLSPIQRARVADALRSSARLNALESLERMRRLLRDTLEPVDLVVIGMNTPGSSVADVVRDVRRECPMVPVVVYLDRAVDQSSTIPSITEAGVHEIIVPGYNDEGVRLRAAILAARRFCAAAWILDRLSSVVPARLLRFVEAVLADPCGVDSVDALAMSAGVHRKTLYNWCRITRFFGPGDLLLWCRLALVAHYLGITRCTVEIIARDLGYPSDTALRNTLKRNVGLTATELRDRGGLEPFLEIFKARIAVYRQGRQHTT
jgi:AraC-like DNA-binding protein